MFDLPGEDVLVSQVDAWVFVRLIIALVVFCAWLNEWIALLLQPNVLFEKAVLPQDWRTWAFLSLAAVAGSISHVGANVVDIGFIVVPIIYSIILLWGWNHSWECDLIGHGHQLVYVVRKVPALILQVVGLCVGFYVWVVIFGKSTNINSLRNEGSIPLLVLQVAIAVSHVLWVVDFKNLNKVYSWELSFRVSVWFLVSIVIGFGPYTVFFPLMELLTRRWLTGYGIAILLYLILVLLAAANEWDKVPEEVA